MAKVDTESPALRTLRTRLRSSLQHLELVDAALSLVEEAAKGADPKLPLLKALGLPGKPETLQVPARQAGQLCNFSRGENLELALLAFHVHFLDYLRTVLADVHLRHPLHLLAGGMEGEPSWERIVQRFEGRGGADELVGRILEATGVQLDPDVGRQAHVYLSMRDLYVYNGGLVDEEFARLHGGLWHLQPGHKLPRNLKIGRTAAHALERLATELDAKLAELGTEG